MLHNLAMTEVPRQLLEAHGDIRVMVNAAAPGRQSKGFAEASGRAERKSGWRVAPGFSDVKCNIWEYIWDIFIESRRGIWESWFFWGWGLKLWNIEVKQQWTTALLSHKRGYDWMRMNICLKVWIRLFWGLQSSKNVGHVDDGMVVVFEPASCCGKYPDLRD